jgi:hypothetical protein
VLLSGHEIDHLADTYGYGLVSCSWGSSARAFGARHERASGGGNRMQVPRFIAFDVLGGVAWALLNGLGSF